MKVAMLVKLAGIGAVLVGAAAIFAFTAGRLSPGRMTQSRMVAAFQDASGSQPGFRLNHAKGICFTGIFQSNGQAVPLSKAAVFEAGGVPVIGRFSLAGGMPFQADKPATVRSMALRLVPKDGDEWRTATVNLPVFVVNSARGFYDFTLATAPDPATGKPYPAHMATFLAAHPESVKAMALIKQTPISSGFADSTYSGLDAFRFVNAAGESAPVRWSFVPLQPVVAESAPQSASAGQNYLFDALIAGMSGAGMSGHRLQWRLVVTVGEPDDPTNDATLPWPASRRQFDAGTLTVDHLSSEAKGRCTDVNYDPLVLPSGIEASDDPLLSARSAVYARSFTLRAVDRSDKTPSAITPQDVHEAGR